MYALFLTITKTIFRAIISGRGGARKAAQPGLNQWMNAKLIKIILNNIALGLINIEIYMGKLSWARAAARLAWVLASPLISGM
jgi:hypothetical protein